MGAMISTAELATIKGCTKQYVRRLAQTGKLPFTEKPMRQITAKSIFLTLIRWTKKSVSDTIIPSAKSLK